MVVKCMFYGPLQMDEEIANYRQIAEPISATSHIGANELNNAVGWPLPCEID